MSASDSRLRSSLKKQNIWGKKSFSGVTRNVNSIDVGEELAKIQPSQQLLNFYRETVTRLEEQHEDILQIFEKYKKASRPTFEESVRQDMTRELIELRSALSDINVFLHAERQQVTRLHAENEQLQVALLEAEKKVMMLLTLSGLTEGELKVFLRDPRHTTIIKQRLPRHLKALHQKLRQDLLPLMPGESVESDAELRLKSEIKSLKQQLKESERNWHNEKDALLQDRTLKATENKLQASKDEAHIKLLIARLEESQNIVTEAIENSIKVKSKMQEQEMKWLAEKDNLLTMLTSVQDNMSVTSHLEAIDRSGSYSDLTKVKSSCELKDLRRENELLKVEAAEAEELRAMYEAQCFQLEQRMCKLREESEAAEQMFKERNQKLLKQNKILQNENIKLDERRKTDIKGFQASIKLLKEDMKTVVHQIYKLTAALSGDTIPVDFETLTEMQAVTTLVRAVQNAIEAQRKALVGDRNCI